MPLEMETKPPRGSSESVYLNVRSRNSEKAVFAAMSESFAKAHQKGLAAAVVKGLCGRRISYFERSAVWCVFRVRPPGSGMVIGVVRPMYFNWGRCVVVVIGELGNPRRMRKRHMCGFPP